MKRTPHRALVLTASLAAVVGSLPSFAVGTRRFELGSAEDFKGGDLSGVAVASDGRLLPGWDLGSIPVADGTSVWAALSLGAGKLLLATGNEGKLVEVDGGNAKVVAETKQLAATSLVQAWGGAVIVGTLPEGKVFKWAGGKLTELATLKEADHVWSLAFDRKSNSVFAATGPHGKLFRIDQNGGAQVHLDVEEEHLMSVAVAPDGAVWAGSSDKARLYKVTAPGRATVVHDFGRTEVRGIAFGSRGETYAIANELMGGSFAGGFSRGMATAAMPTAPSSGARGRGILVQFDADGTPDTLLDDSSEHFVSLTVDPEGKPVVGTGAEGRVIVIEEAHRSVVMADVAERQVSAVLLGGATPFVVGSDPITVRPIKGRGGAEATWTSKVLDAGLRARFGRLAWDGTGALELSTRSGNTNSPDATWSPWSKPITAPGVVQGSEGRFLQIRARLKGQDAELGRVEIAFVTDNLRATVTAVEVTSALQRPGGGGAGGGVTPSGGAVSKSTDARVNLSWRVDNPDNDELRYRLQYRVVGTSTWYDILKPGEKLTGTSYSWDVSSLPEGRYRVRVLASDEPSNPPDRVKRHERESGVVLVDVTAPTLEGLKVAGRRIQGAAVDGVGPIQRVEVSVAGTEEWVPFYPVDGIYDEAREELDLDVSGIVPAGGALVSVRVFDQAGNVVVRSVTVGK